MIANHILYACCRKLGQSTERVRTTGSHFSGGSSASWRVWERGWHILMPFWSIQCIDIYSYLSLLLATCLKTFASVCNMMQIFWKGRESVCLWKVCIKWKSALDKKFITTCVCTKTGCNKLHYESVMYFQYSTFTLKQFHVVKHFECWLYGMHIKPRL